MGNPFSSSSENRENFHKDSLSSKKLKIDKRKKKDKHKKKVLRNYNSSLWSLHENIKYRKFILDHPKIM